MKLTNKIKTPQVKPLPGMTPLGIKTSNAKPKSKPKKKVTFKNNVNIIFYLPSAQCRRKHRHA